ncbi:MAG TPA: hypothetical protein VL974_04460 [Magnetospirillum sp.]|jgi:spore coat polysaccharide biosynthesis predicted glycosyltransferase SpsG|nr:hypothetical protein [Magnetospirillum sp.]
MADLLFVVDALPETGFGHAARCLALAGMMRDGRPGLAIAFQGRFSEGARARIAEAAPGISIVSPDQAIAAQVCVVDRMAAPLDIDAVDRDLAAGLAQRCGRLVHISSGTRDPRLPEDWLVVGYHPGGPAPVPPRLLWGLDFVPTDIGEPLDHVVRDPKRLLVALGGYQMPGAVTRVLAAAALVPEIAAIDVLASPVADETVDCGVLRPDQSLTVHRNVPSVFPLIAAAGTVLASMGNLAYEALALGTPACLIGQKQFQSDIARVLDRMGLAVAGGMLAEQDVAGLAAGLSATMERAPALSGAASAAVPRDGLRKMTRAIEAFAGR